MIKKKREDKNQSRGTWVLYILRCIFWYERDGEIRNVCNNILRYEYIEMRSWRVDVAVQIWKNSHFQSINCHYVDIFFHFCHIFTKLSTTRGSQKIFDEGGFIFFCMDKNFREVGIFFSKTLAYWRNFLSRGFTPKNPLTANKTIST